MTCKSKGCGEPTMGLGSPYCVDHVDLVAAYETGVRDTLAARRGSGLPRGRRPFGHYLDERLPLQMMLRLRGEGSSAAQIASALNDVGHYRRDFGPWTRQAVWRVLRAQRDVV